MPRIHTKTALLAYVLASTCLLPAVAGAVPVKPVCEQSSWSNLKCKGHATPIPVNSYCYFKPEVLTMTLRSGTSQCRAVFDSLRSFWPILRTPAGTDLPKIARVVSEYTGTYIARANKNYRCNITVAYEQPGVYCAAPPADNDDGL